MGLTGRRAAALVQAAAVSGAVNGATTSETDEGRAADPAGKSVICRGLGHRFVTTGYLFTGLDLTLEPGEVIGLIGPSGSGKSTLLSILAGWLTPSEGSVERQGIDRLGWVLQNPHGTPRRTAIDQVTYPLLAQGLSREDAHGQAAAIMSRFGLDAVAERQFKYLSGGEAQRLMLARAVASANDLLLVDEPTAQLDPQTAATVSDVLSNIAQEQAIVVVATNDPRTAQACSRVIDLADFQAAHGNPDEADGTAVDTGLRAAGRRSGEDAQDSSLGAGLRAADRADTASAGEVNGV